MKYHPDKVATAGEEIRKQATEKFRELMRRMSISKSRGEYENNAFGSW